MPDDDHQPNRQAVFEGFSSPRYTQVPDTIFDVLLPDLPHAELKVLLYIVRRTFGFGKDSDNISLRQLCTGIVTADGRQLDRGTGLSKTSVTNALLSLRQRGILIRTKNRDFERGNMPTNYRLRMAGEPLDAADEPPVLENDPLSILRDKGVHDIGQGEGLFTAQDKGVHTTGQGVSTSFDKPLSRLQDKQETVEQKTEEQERDFETSKDKPPGRNSFATRLALQPYIEDFAREFADQAKQSSTLSRAVDLCERSGLDVDEFIDAMLVARATTKENSASIKSTVPGDRWGKKAAIPYFFSVLEDMLGLTSKRNMAE